MASVYYVSADEQKKARIAKLVEITLALESVCLSKKTGQDPRNIILTTGTHHLSVISELYRNEVRTFSVSQAKETILDIELKPIAPEIRIIAPENAIIYLDDTLMENTVDPIIVAPGEHIIQFKLGDYELTKNIIVINGITYTINLAVNIDV